MRRRRQQREQRLRRLGAGGTILGAVAAGALAVRRRGSSGRASEVPAEAPQPQEWHCECGQAFRVSGADRHRVLWLPDAAPEDPVVDDRCPACERELSAQG